MLLGWFVVRRTRARRWANRGACTKHARPVRHPSVRYRTRGLYTERPSWLDFGASRTNALPITAAELKLMTAAARADSREIQKRDKARRRHRYTDDVPAPFIVDRPSRYPQLSLRRVPW